MSYSIGFDLKIPTSKIEKTIRKHKISDDFELVKEVDISQSLYQSEIFKIQSDSCVDGYVYVSRINSCRAGGCSVNSSTDSDGFEYFDYFLITDKDAKVIYVKVYNYQATHGHQIMSRGWLKQFVGYDGSENLVYGQDIQAISGATISAKGITIDISRAEKLLSEIVDN